MPQIFSRGDSVYQCDTCNRRIRVPANDYGLEVVQRCIITNDCPGKLHRVTLRKDINNTPATTPNVSGIQNWVQRNILFDYTQSIDATVWKISHQLGSVPSVQVFVNKDTSDGEVSVETTDYTVLTVDSNTIHIVFTTPQSGTVQCIAYASQNTTNPPPAATVVSASDMQISNGGILTIATWVGVYPTDQEIDVTLNCRNPTDNTVSEHNFLNIDNIPDATSPWAGAYQIMVAGRIFDVRSFDVTVDGSIPYGSRIVVSVDGEDITAYKQILVLLGKSPYAVPDRITDKYIDLAAINPSQPELFYTNGELWCSTTKVKATYPPVVVVE